LGENFTGGLRRQVRGTFGPEDVFHYIYAVFHAPGYRRRYAEFLKIDFPRAPLPTGKSLFGKLCKLGQQLCGLHLLEAEILEEQNKWPAFNIEGSGIIEKGYPKYILIIKDQKVKKHKSKHAHEDVGMAPGAGGRVYINQDQYFEGIGPEVWGFHIGGYQVCEKWLKDRRNRKLDYEDICHYQKITVALGETIQLMGQVDKVIEANSGWPMG
jgi:predicted helicase